MTVDSWRDIGLIVAAWIGASLVVATIIFFLFVRKLRRLDIPPNAGFAETLLYTPFIVVVFIDLLDWGLDILAAPVVWVVLDRLGLRALRNVSAIEALIPFTQPIPTLTASWIWVRLFGPDRLPEVDTIVQQPQRQKDALRGE